MKILKIITSTKPDAAVLKNGRKVYATVSFNENPDYNYCLWLHGGVCLSGYETKEAAINRGKQMFAEWQQVLSQFKN